MVDFSHLDAHMERLLQQGAFPSATLAIFHHDRLVKETAYGIPDPEACWPARTDTRYDVASISKLFAGTAFLRLCEERIFALDEPISKSFPAFTGKREIRASANALLKDQPDDLLGYGDVTNLTWKNVLIHDSGLGYCHIYERCRDKAAAIDHICAMPLAYAPESTVLYTDLGLILMGVAMERRLQKGLDEIVKELVTEPLGLMNTGYNRVSLGAQKENTAPTEICAWRGGRVHGLVHDENCYFLDGVAGHAGIFSTAKEAAMLAQTYLDALRGRPALVKPETARKVVQFQKMNRWDRRGILFQLRILDTDAHSFPLGRFAFGHTGFTGTCLWCDPERELCFALLTNDVYAGRENRTLGSLRKGIVEELVSAIDREDLCK
ncbi:MAG: beta-lactamase family protein [Clostridia bacterium]|nr:beta-lactamase family protein [Clostridia bacterium]